MIKCHNLSIKFKDKTLFENLHVEIKNHIAILGENGAGKSSLAKAICNFIPFSGSISLDEKDIQTFSPKELASTISYIPAKLDNADKYLKVFDFVLMGRYIHKNSFFDYAKEEREKTTAILDSLNLKHLTESFLHEVSSGEAQLILIAQALLSESSTLIFDEPTANLDPKNAHKIFTILNALKSSHHIILITHDIHLAKNFNENILFIQNHQALSLKKEDFFTSAMLSKLYACTFDENLRVAYV